METNSLLFKIGTAVPYDTNTPRLLFTRGKGARGGKGREGEGRDLFPFFQRQLGMTQTPLDYYPLGGRGKKDLANTPRLLSTVLLVRGPKCPVAYVLSLAVDVLPVSHVKVGLPVSILVDNGKGGRDELVKVFP